MEKTVKNGQKQPNDETLRSIVKEAITKLLSESTGEYLFDDDDDEIINNPDGVCSDIDGKNHYYDDDDAYPFIYDLRNNKFHFGNEHGDTHTNMMQYEMDLDKQERETLRKNSLQGRYWQSINTFSIWDNPEPPIVKKVGDNLIQKLGGSIRPTLKYAAPSKIYNFGDYINPNKSTQKETPVDIEKLNQAKAVHLMRGEEKRQALNGYLDDKYADIGKKLSYSNGKGEMPMAQWRALHSTSEALDIFYVDKLVSEAVDEISHELRRNVYNKYKDTDPERAAKFAQHSAERDRKIFPYKDGQNAQALGRYHDMTTTPDGQRMMLSVLSKRVKANDPTAIKIAARMLADTVKDDSILIPAPQSSGHAEYTLAIANEIARLNPTCQVIDLFISNKRERMYDRKKNGEDAKGITNGFRIKSASHYHRLFRRNQNVYIIDNNIHTGRTFQELQNVIMEKFGVSPILLAITHAKTSKSVMKILARYTNYLEQ